MQRMFAEVADEFAVGSRHVEVVETPEPESALLDRLASVQEEFPVKVGSYPGENVRIRFTGTDPDLVAEAAAWMRERVELAEDCFCTGRGATARSGRCHRGRRPSPQR